ncbi:hypothetical protein OHB00_07790 [Streptomyces sp. NBC_00631]|uniref:hypothetical protein n=1 Tax=Streptomyces sp. NBC_00631 TaxID=2975793 RepID=UPI0030DECF7F
MACTAQYAGVTVGEAALPLTAYANRCRARLTETARGLVSRAMESAAALGTQPHG